ncbi:ent-kaurene synthase 1, chloroplastic-like [Rutidosis leptorrhynchoides]|uniref:ent-kaurene synthase 1, chloroplastic-like n=1 Tax=Rutidosis leptorrhynchoides TaxID=125765 RepID=UPI003A9939B3
MAYSTSSVMGVPLSLTTRQSSLVVSCCIERHNSSTFHAGKANFVVRRFCIKSSSQSRQANLSFLNLQMTKERIRKLFNNVELSVSSYDTAWVAMVPSPNAPKSPCFPECLNWLKDNQLDDGSWGLVQSNSPILVKDALSSTLASVVALKRWNVGEDQINKGLRFIQLNSDFATDYNQPSPVGFDIIFPGMLEYAKLLNLNLPFKQEQVNLLLHVRDSELNRCDLEQREVYLAYISEGLNKSYDWSMINKYKMKNGSILNSPSATAAALIHHQDAGCLNYLTSVLDKFGNAVPTAYPLELYIRLFMVDTLERLGVTRHFRVEIQNVLDEMYRYWLQRDENIFMDVGTCALACKVLRTNGYEVSLDNLNDVTEEGDESLEGYKASQINYQQDSSLRNENLASIEFLTRKLYTASNNLSEFIREEVENPYRFSFHSDLERISTRSNIKQYIVDDTRTLKTTYRSSNISNEDFLRLAVEDYNACQSIYREELKGVERWVEENSLNKLDFARQYAINCYFLAALTFSSPELSDARISFAKSSTLIGVVDDFFDVHQGSTDELVNLTRAVQKWNVDVDTYCCSEEVRIIFLAIKDIVNGIGDMAYKWQQRDVTSHVIKTWCDMVKSMLTETIWARDSLVPTMQEYMENGYVSFAAGPSLLHALYLIGPKLSEEAVQSADYHKLYELLSTHGRLINDIRSFKRDMEAGRLNVVSLYNNHKVSGIKKEEVIEVIRMLINNHERKLLNLVSKEKSNSIPRACKDAIWKMCNVVNLLYSKDDGFIENPIIENIVNEIIYKPVSHTLINETNEDL